MTHDNSHNRADFYEELYHRPDDIRQYEQKMVGEALQAVIRKRNVFEVGCSTGYWTQFISPAAINIVAIDPRPEAVEIARAKSYFCPVTFEVLDPYDLPYHEHSFDGGVVSFWFHDIPRERLGEFLTEFHRVLKPGSHVFIADEVREGGYTSSNLVEALAPYAESFGQGNIFFAKHYWYAAYTVKEAM